jgi:hypothetical protein
MPWGQFFYNMSLPLGVPVVNFDLLGGMFTPSFTPRDEHALLFIRRKGRTEGQHPNLNVREQSSPPRANWRRGTVVIGYAWGLPDFSWYKIPKRGKIYRITTNYTKCP